MGRFKVYGLKMPNEIQRNEFQRAGNNGLSEETGVNCKFQLLAMVGWAVLSKIS